MKLSLRPRLGLCAALALGLGAAAAGQEAAGQEPLRPFKIQIRHADPWVVKALIEGAPVRTPEMSTMPGFGGLISRAAGNVISLLKDGYLVVNPTDNSLWYYPKHVGS